MIAAAMLRSLRVVLIVSLFCSLLVSAATILLTPRQQANLHDYMVRNILIAADLLQEGMSSETIFKRRIKPELIDLNSGEQIDASVISPNFSLETFDIKYFTDDPELSVAIPPEQDIAKIVRRPKYMVVYIANSKGHPDLLILPVYGKGLWSTVFGLLALKRDLRTVEGITFYQHGETPGLGGEIDNPRWQRNWLGKTAINTNGQVILDVIKGQVDPSSPEAAWQVDGLAGATLTGIGVENLIHYWLSENGYGPLLNRLRREWAAVPTPHPR
ncbi:MAG: Na(+)-translocating NADH-quinone reductase subunit C [Gammaproteobacteria bacterium]